MRPMLADFLERGITPSVPAPRPSALYSVFSPVSFRRNRRSGRGEAADWGESGEVPVFHDFSEPESICKIRYLVIYYGGQIAVLC